MLKIESKGNEWKINDRFLHGSCTRGIPRRAGAYHRPCQGHNKLTTTITRPFLHNFTFITPRRNAFPSFLLCRYTRLARRLDVPTQFMYSNKSKKIQTHKWGSRLLSVNKTGTYALLLFAKVNKFCGNGYVCKEK